MQITGVSMAAHAHRVADRAEAEKALELLMHRYPPQESPLALTMPSPDEVAIFRVTPAIISVLDYAQGFGHTDLVSCEEEAAVFA